MEERNVVVICLDTVRKDYFDEYAPRLQALADVSIEECRAASSWTVPSHASMFTGELPHRHGVHAGQLDFTHLDVEDTFLGKLPNHHSVGISANAFASSAFGFDCFFDEFHDVVPSVVFPDGMYLRDFESEHDGPAKLFDYLRQAAGSDHPVKSLINGLAHVARNNRPSFLPRRDDDGAELVTELAIQAVDNISEPYVLFLNYMDAHGPFAPTTRYDDELYTAPHDWSSDEIDIWEFNMGKTEKYATDVQYYRELYRAAIDYLDRRIEQFIRTIERCTDRETTFVITADHGENLGYESDNGLIEHKGSLTEGLLHVPLLVRNPPEILDTSNNYLSHLELASMLETIAYGDFCLPQESKIPAELIGIEGNTDTIPEDAYEYWDRMIRAVYEGAHKLEWDSQGGQQRYMLDAVGPNSQQDVSSDGVTPAAYDDFFDVPIESYKSNVRAYKSNREVADSVETRLTELGYR